MRRKSKNSLTRTGKGTSLICKGKCNAKQPFYASLLFTLDFRDNNMNHLKLPETSSNKDLS